MQTLYVYASTLLAQFAYHYHSVYTNFENKHSRKAFNQKEGEKKKT